MSQFCRSTVQDRTTVLMWSLTKVQAGTGGAGAKKQSHRKPGSQKGSQLPHVTSPERHRPSRGAPPSSQSISFQRALPSVVMDCVSTPLPHTFHLRLQGSRVCSSWGAPKVTGTESKPEREIFHLLIPSTDGHSGQGSARLKPGAGNSSGPPMCSAGA